MSVIVSDPKNVTSVNQPSVEGKQKSTAVGVVQWLFVPKSLFASLADVFRSGKSAGSNFKEVVSELASESKSTSSSPTEWAEAVKVYGLDEAKIFMMVGRLLFISRLSLIGFIFGFATLAVYGVGVVSAVFSLFTFYKYVDATHKLECIRAKSLFPLRVFLVSLVRGEYSYWPSSLNSGWRL